MAPHPIPPHKAEGAAWGMVMAFVVSPLPCEGNGALIRPLRLAV